MSELPTSAFRFLSEDSGDVRSQLASEICNELRSGTTSLASIVLGLGEWLTSSDVERRKSGTALLMEVEQQG